MAYKSIEKARAQGRKFYANNREARLAAQAKYRAENPEKDRERRIRSMEKKGYKRRLFEMRRNDARRKGIEFTITFESIQWPERCPITDVVLQYAWTHGQRRGPRETSPCIDRTDCRKGYVPGNVGIISAWANWVKTNGTRDMLERIVAYMKERGAE